MKTKWGLIENEEMRKDIYYKHTVIKDQQTYRRSYFFNQSCDSLEENVFLNGVLRVKFYNRRVSELIFHSPDVHLLQI